MKKRVVERLSGLLFADTPALSAAERRLSTLGAVVCIALCGWLLQMLPAPGFPIIAPVGASAIILFAMPHSPVAQPWPVAGGFFFATLAGIICANLLPWPLLSAALAVALCVWLMARFNCIHPPGGALALMIGLDSAPVHLSTWHLAEVIAVNVFLLLSCALLINRLLLQRHYPHGVRAPAEGDSPTVERAALNHEDLDSAIRKLDIFVDVSEDDLVDLYNLAIEHAFSRHSELVCGDIMSRDVICTAFDTELEVAWQLLRTHKLRVLPVLDNYHRLIGIVSASDFLRHVDGSTAAGAASGLRALLKRTPGQYSDKPEVVGQIMTAKVHTVHAGTPVADLLRESFAQGTHHIPVIDDRRQVVGMIGRSDIIGALYRQIALSRGEARTAEVKASA